MLSEGPPRTESIASIEPRIMEINNTYEIDGLTIEKVHQHLNKLSELIKDRNKPVLQENSFYLNSSDSLETLKSMDFSGKKVLTVAGSGEFAHTFINGNCSEVCEFDVSPIALLYAEMRHVGLCVLNYEQYNKMFGKWTGVYEADDRFKADVFDIETYRNELRHHISDQAKELFDGMIENKELMNTDLLTSWGGIARIRFNQKYKKNRFIGDYVSEEDYLELQNKARGTPVTFSAREIDSLGPLLETYEPDTVYISNIGYYSEHTIPHAQRFLEAGANEVIFTIGRNDGLFRYDHKDDEFGNHSVEYSHFDTKIERGTIFDYKEKYGIEEDTDPLRIEVLNIDENADYGIVLRISKEL
jgi:hypothetical protein